MQSKKVLRFKFPLITHIAKTNNKIVANKMFKINNQAFYSQSLNRFSRAIVVENMHNYVISNLNTDVKGITKVEHILYEFRVVRNFNNIRFIRGKLSWKKPDKNYDINWDVNNIADIWIKTGNDSLTLAGILKDDNASVINLTSYRVVFVDDIKDMTIEIILKNYE